MAYIIGAIIGYLLGCINMANIIAKSRGINIKKVGSNNAGASNVFLSVGKAYGVAVGAFDVLKSFCAAELVYMIFSRDITAGVIAGAMAVIGHNFPFWMHFNGGKGLAPFMGLVLFYDWKLFIAFALIIAFATLVLDYISIGALAVTTLLPLCAAFIYKDYIGAAIFLVIGIVMWLRHLDNIKRLMNGTEIGFRGKNKPKNKEP